MIGFLKKNINKILESMAKRRLVSNHNVNIHPGAKINTWRRILLVNGSSLQIGSGTVIDGSIITEHSDAKVVIGKNCYMGGSRIISACEIEIGDDVLISWGVFFYDHNSHATSWPERAMDVYDHYHGRGKNWSHVKKSKIKVSDKAWIGFNSLILKGVTIGEGAIVAAGSVVTKDISPWTVVGGNPAKTIRVIPENERA